MELPHTLASASPDIHPESTTAACSGHDACYMAFCLRCRMPLLLTTLLAAAAHSLRPVNNTCMDKATQPPPGPRTFDCRNFVITSTDQTWHQRNMSITEAAIDLYFAQDW